MLKLRLDEIDIFSEEKDFNELSKELSRNDKHSSRTIDFMKETSPGIYFKKVTININVIYDVA